MIQDTVFQAAYFQQWHSWNAANVASNDNKNAIKMMNSIVVITLDEPLPNSFWHFYSYYFSQSD